MIKFSLGAVDYLRFWASKEEGRKVVDGGWIGRWDMDVLCLVWELLSIYHVQNVVQHCAFAFLFVYFLFPTKFKRNSSYVCDLL